MPIWSNVNGGLWTDSANWIGGVPNGPGSQADFVLTGSGALREITFDGNTPVTVDTLNVTITDSQGLWFHGSIADGGAGSGLLIFQTGASNDYGLVTINTAVGGGEFEISSFGELTVQLNNATRFDVVNAGTTARINTSIVGGAGDQLQKAGAGTLLLGAFNNASFSGGFLIEGGILDALDASALGTGNINIRNNAELVSDGTFAGVIHTFDFQTGTAGSARISAHTGTTFSLTGSQTLLGDGVVSFGSSAHAGTVVLDLATWQHSDASTLRIDGGTVRIGNSTLAGNFFNRQSTGLTEISSGATLDLGGFATSIRNLDLDGGTIRTSSGPLGFTANDTTSGTSIVQSGTIEGTSGNDNIVINATNNFSFAGTNFTN